MPAKTWTRILAWLPAVGVVVLAIRVAAVWDQLPARMASHFNIAGQPDGWMQRGDFIALIFGALIGTVAVVVATAARMGHRRGASVVVLAMLSAIGVSFTGIWWQAINASISQGSLNLTWFWAVTACLLVAALAVGIDWRWWSAHFRQRPAATEQQPSRVIAEEVHGSPTMAVVLLALGLPVLIIAIAAAGGVGSILAVLVLAPVVLGGSALWAWRGFQYRFTSSGIEIRTMGVRLRQIPRQEIQEYHAEDCSPLRDFGGWGVKGFGNETAYIWGGHTGVRIRTMYGDVYLGHREPQRLVSDLEAMMKLA